jgi:iron complex outermembrane receptor protein
MAADGAAGAERPKAAGAEGAAVLEEITVTGTRPTNPTTPVETRYGTQYNVVTEEQIKEQNSYDFQSALRDVPGVMFQTKNLVGSQTSHSLYIRGRGMSHPSADFAILFDGVPRFGALFGQVYADSIPVPMIGGMEVFKGPQPSQFGSGYALVNVLPKYMTQEGREATVSASAGSYGTVSEDVSAGVKKGPFDLYMSQSWTRTDGHREHSGASQQSYYANTGFRIGNEWSVRLLLNYVDAGTDAPKPDTTPTATNGVSHPGAERYETQTLFTTMTLGHNYGRAAGYVKAYYDRTNFDLLQELTNGVRYGGNTGGLKSRQEVRLYGVRGKEILHLWPGGEIVFGADLDMTDTKNTQETYSGLATAGINGGLAQRVWDFPGTRIVSPYGAVSHMIGRKEAFHVIPSAGARYYSHDEFKDASAAQGGLVVGYGNTDLNLSYSRGVIYPTPVVLMNFVLQSAPTADASQYWRSLKPEVVDHYEAGIRHRWPDKGSLGATVFRDQGKDRFQAYMFGAIPLTFNDAIGHYETRGLELNGTVIPVKDFELFAATTWLQAEAVGSNRIERGHLPYTPSFQLQAGLKWTFLEKFRLFADMQHLRGLYQGTASRTGTFNFSDPGPVNRLPDATLVNGRIAYRFDYASMHIKGSEVFVAVNNIFNEDYEYAKGYPLPGTTFFAGVSLRFQ